MVYTEDDKSLIIEIYKRKKNVTKTAVEFCNKKNLAFNDGVRRKISTLLHREKVILPSVEQIDLDFKYSKERKLGKSKYYIVTWEQNMSELDLNLWNNILAYKEFLGAELSVILGRYKNPTSNFSEAKHESWNQITKPYWDTNRHDIHPFVTILGDVKIQPTASYPLVGLESITGETTTIVGHPKSHLQPVPVLEGHAHKLLLTTGSITKANYTDSKAGKKGEFHHQMGFIIVEIKDDEVFFVRQICALDDGSFTDLYFNVKDGKVDRVKNIEGLVWGDTHYGSINPLILPKTYDLIKDFQLKYEVHHDLLDGHSVNNHIVNDPIQQYKRFKEGKDCIMCELYSVKEFLEKTPSTIKYVVRSNHNDRFDRWIINVDWKKDIPNAATYMDITAKVLSGEAPKGVVAYMIEEHLKVSNTVCLDYDDTLIINGFELAHHGHIGANGSKGSIEQFRKMSTNIILGHYHKPMRRDKVMSVGTSTYLREGYNKGASDWLNAHIIIHRDNSAQHLIFMKGEFTTLDNFLNS